MRFHLLFRLGAIVVIGVLAISWIASDAQAQGLAAQVYGKQPIPRGSFKTWSIFLVTNQEWLIAENADQLRQLYVRSQAFGRVIGQDHLAVWFWQKTTPLQSPGLAENVDVERAIAYCQKLGRKPSGGPYILFTTVYPDETVVPSSYGIIELGTTSEEIARLLGRLGDQLVTEGLIRNKEFMQPVGSDDFWRAWFNATGLALATLSSGFRLTTKTPTLSLESSRK